MSQYRLITCLNLMLTLIGWGAVVSGAVDEAPFQAGTAKVEITPSEESAVDLLGQPLRLRDSLFARVLVLKDENVSIAIVSVVVVAL